VAGILFIISNNRKKKGLSGGLNCRHQILIKMNQSYRI
jgi:hypothetical protein